MKESNKYLQWDSSRYPQPSLSLSSPLSFYLALFQDLCIPHSYSQDPQPHPLTCLICIFVLCGWLTPSPSQTHGSASPSASTLTRIVHLALVGMLGNWYLCLCVYPFICIFRFFVHWFIRSLTPSSTYLFIHSFILSRIHRPVSTVPSFSFLSCMVIHFAYFKTILSLALLHFPFWCSTLPLTYSLWTRPCRSFEPPRPTRILLLSPL